MKNYAPIGYNVLRAGEVFYFGLFVALSFRQKYCNKVKQISTLKYIAIFFLQEVQSSFKLNAPSVRPK